MVELAYYNYLNLGKWYCLITPRDYGPDAWPDSDPSDHLRIFTPTQLNTSYVGRVAV